MSLPAIKPMVLTRFSEPFSHPDWLFEVKHDGFRALAYIVDGDCRLVSRRNHVYKSFAPLCQSIVSDLKAEDAVLDGELVCLGENCHSQFNQLMFRRGDPHFYAFDLLWLNGEDLRRKTEGDRPPGDLDGANPRAKKFYCFAFFPADKNRRWPEIISTLLALSGRYVLRADPATVGRSRP